MDGHIAWVLNLHPSIHGVHNHIPLLLEGIHGFEGFKDFIEGSQRKFPRTLIVVGTTATKLCASDSVPHPNQLEVTLLMLDDNLIVWCHKFEHESEMGDLWDGKHVSLLVPNLPEKL